MEIVAIVLIVSFVVGGFWYSGWSKMRGSSRDIVESGYVKADTELPNKWMVPTRESLEKELGGLRLECYRLKNDNEVLARDYEELNEKHGFLKHDYDELKESFESLQKAYGYLKADKDRTDLLVENEYLKMSNMVLSGEPKDKDARYAYYKDLYFSMLGDYSNLLEDYDEMVVYFMDKLLEGEL